MYPISFPSHSFPFQDPKEKRFLKGNSPLPSHRDPIITRSCAKEMSTSGPSLIEENTHEIALLKEQVVEMIRMRQQ